MTNSRAPSEPVFVFTPSKQYLLVNWEVFPFRGELYQNEKVNRVNGLIQLSGSLYPSHSDMFKSCSIFYKTQAIFNANKKYSFPHMDFIYEFKTEVKKRQIQVTDLEIEEFLQKEKLEKL